MSELSKNKNNKSSHSSKPALSNELSQIEFDNLLDSTAEINEYDKKKLYKTLHTVVEASPNIWEHVFKYISLLPQKAYWLCYQFIFKSIIFFSRLTSWFIITMLDDSEFIKKNNIRKLWEYLRYMPTNVIKFVLKDTIYQKYNIDEYINNYVQFIFLIRNEPKSERNRIINDTKKILIKCKNVKTYKLDKLWKLFKNINYVNELKISNTEIINYYKESFVNKSESKSENNTFENLYNSTMKNKIWNNKTIKDDINTLLNNHKKLNTSSNK